MENYIQSYRSPFCFVFALVYHLKSLKTTKAKLIPIKTPGKKSKLKSTYLLQTKMNIRKQGEHNTVWYDFLFSDTLWIVKLNAGVELKLCGSPWDLYKYYCSNNCICAYLFIICDLKNIYMYRLKLVVPRCNK